MNDLIFQTIIFASIALLSIIAVIIYIRNSQSTASNTDAYSHEDDHSFSPKLITCSHPC